MIVGCLRIRILEIGVVVVLLRLWPWTAMMMYVADWTSVTRAALGPSAGGGYIEDGRLLGSGGGVRITTARGSMSAPPAGRSRGDHGSGEEEGEEEEGRGGGSSAAPARRVGQPRAVGGGGGAPSPTAPPTSDGAARCASAASRGGRGGAANKGKNRASARG